ncbi:MAG: carotenoid biosynthesis protein [Anaerolineales bacterium]|nr:carotenoid biosynthesis protein [Anaerolineales bacterium]
MPDPYFLVFEGLQYALLLLCLRHAARQGPARVWQLLAGVLYGLLLEWATIQQLHAYSYGRFLLMLGDVPVPIGVGWGVIVYSVRLFSDATTLPEWARPVLDGLLALNMDLALDALAIRLGMWDWGMGLQLQYFGVPYANFWAWFWVVFAFSTGLRVLARPATFAGRWLGPLGALALGVLDVIAMNALITSVAPAWYLPTIALTLGLALAVVLSLRPRFGAVPAAPPAFWVPFVVHVYCLAAGLLSGVLLRPPVLLLVSALMLALALLLHRQTISAWLRRGPALPAASA